jgi:methyl-accepting chemotaxis protein
VRALVGDVRDVGEALGHTASRLAHLADATIGAIGAQIEVVDDMAERSKLLALNAAIESARAGEHGRGFAVIAQELHRLATTSQEAGGTVKTLVTGVVEETRSLVRGAHDARALAAGAVERAVLTGGTIALLVAEIGDNAGDARAIGAIADEQAERAAEIELATAEMRRMAEATACAAQVAGELSGRVAETIGMAADVAAGVVGETRASRGGRGNRARRGRHRRGDRTGRGASAACLERDRRAAGGDPVAGGRRGSLRRARARRRSRS